jgi:carbon-monoxide dehydrogenase iron sulfur subunit
MPKSKPRTMVFRAVPQMCDGCRLCEMVCSLKHTGRINVYLARIRVVSSEDDGAHPIICRHCKNPPCQSACPVPGAMVQDEQSGAVVIDDSKCISCLACVEACPFGAIQVGPNREILKCDLCGGDPECVKYCQPRDHLPRFPWPMQSCLQYVEGRKVATLGKSKLTGKQ